MSYEWMSVSRLLDMLKSQNVRFQFRTILIPGRPQQSHQEHAAIVEAVAAHDPDRAEEAMRTHLSHVADALKATKPPSSPSLHRAETNTQILLTFHENLEAS